MTGALRSMGKADVPQVAQLEGDNQPSPWSEGVFLDELAADNRIYLVLEEGRIVGFGGLMLIGEEAHVTNLLVDPKERRRGRGRVLMAGLISRAREAGAHHLTLEVRTKNEAARALYSGFGLAPVGVRPGYYNDDDALILWVHDIHTDSYGDRLSVMLDEASVEGAGGDAR